MHKDVLQRLSIQQALDSRWLTNVESIAISDDELGEDNLSSSSEGGNENQ